MHPKYYVKRRAVPIETQNGSKVRTRSAKVYESVDPEQELRNNRERTWHPEKENIPVLTPSGQVEAGGDHDDIKSVRDFIATCVNDKHKKNYSRRSHQLNNCGYHAAINKAYEGMGDPFYLEEKKVILHGLGQWGEVRKKGRE